LDLVRVILGFDAIVVFEVDLGNASVRRANLSQIAAVPLPQCRQIEAAINALDRFGFIDWTRVIDSIWYVTDPDDQIRDRPDHVPYIRKENRTAFRYDDPLPGLKNQLRGEPLPYAVVAGCRPVADTEGVQIVYAALWVQDGFEASVPLTLAAELIDRSLADEPLDPGPTSPPLALIVPGVRDVVEVLTDGEKINIPLREGLLRTYDSEEGILSVEGLSQDFRGRGSNFESAWKDFVRQIYEHVQSLYRTRPFNRSEQQERVWRLLCRHINIQAYRESRPMRLFRIGTITAAPSEHERVVTWEEDAREDRVLKGQAPPEFFKEYQVCHRFEAMVYYNRQSNQLDHIDEVKRLGPEITDEEAWEFWRTIPRLGD
jgi:hypothetical protein